MWPANRWQGLIILSQSWRKTININNLFAKETRHLWGECDCFCDNAWEKGQKVLFGKAFTPRSWIWHSLLRVRRNTDRKEYMAVLVAHSEEGASFCWDLHFFLRNLFVIRLVLNTHVPRHPGSSGIMTFRCMLCGVCRDSLVKEKRKGKSLAWLTYYFQSWMWKAFEDSKILIFCKDRVPKLLMVSKFFPSLYGAVLPGEPHASSPRKYG